MTSSEEEARLPFLQGANDEESRDAAIELPELRHGHARSRPNHVHDSEPKATSDQASSGNRMPYYEDSNLPKKPATYAILFMLGAQIFSASMNVSIRLLENATTHLHPLQVCRHH